MIQPRASHSWQTISKSADHLTHRVPPHLGRDDEPAGAAGIRSSNSMMPVLLAVLAGGRGRMRHSVNFPC
jgi:hypothetical protein